MKGEVLRIPCIQDHVLSASVAEATTQACVLCEKTLSGKYIRALFDNLFPGCKHTEQPNFPLNCLTAGNQKTNGKSKGMSDDNNEKAVPGKKDTSTRKKPMEVEEEECGRIRDKNKCPCNSCKSKGEICGHQYYSIRTDRQLYIVCCTFTCLCISDD